MAAAVAVAVAAAAPAAAEAGLELPRRGMDGSCDREDEDRTTVNNERWRWRCTRRVRGVESDMSLGQALCPQHR